MGSSAKDDFDPYHAWLGIRKSEQPPSLYRLVGVSEFEDSMEVIRNAFLQRHSLLQALAVGKKRELASKLLEEVIRAKQILLDADAKTDYDSSLREKARSCAGTPKFTWVSTRSKRPRSSVPMLLQIVLGGAVGIGGGLAILKYIWQKSPQVASKIEVDRNSVAVEPSVPTPSRSNLPRAQAVRRERASQPAATPSLEANEPASADVPPPESEPPVASPLPQADREMTIHQLRNVSFALPDGDRIVFEELLPDVDLVQNQLRSAIRYNTYGSGPYGTQGEGAQTVAFKDENGVDYAYLSRNGNDLEGHLVVLNEQQRPAIVGQYADGKRAGAILMLDESQRLLFAGQFKNRDLHGRVALFRLGRPVVIVDCLPKQFLAVHHCEENEIIHTFSPAQTDPFFAEIQSEIHAFEECYLETEQTVRKSLNDLDEDERQFRAAVKSLEVRERLAARRSARAAANAAAMSAAIDRVPRETRTFVLPPIRAAR